MPALGKVSPTTTADTLLYAVPQNTRAAVNVSLTNRSGASADVTLSVIGATDLGVASVGMTAIGTGLTSIPTLAITGANGSGATAVVTALQLTEGAIAAGGAGYAVGARVTVAGGTAATAAVLRVTAVDANGAATATEVDTTVASRYSAVITGTTSTPATTTVIAGSGSGLTLTVASLRYGIATVNVTAQGNDYTAAPTITPSSGTGAVFALQMVRGGVEDKDAIEFRVPLPASGVLERTGLVLGAGAALFVKSSTANSLNAFAFGVESIA